MLMPCRSFENNSHETPVIDQNGGNHEDNSADEVWSEDDGHLEADNYVQLADQREDTGVFSSDDDDDSFEEDKDVPSSFFQETSPLEFDIDSRIEQELSLPDLDTNVGPGFPNVIPLNLNYEPSTDSEQVRWSNFSLTETDENFIRNSMSVLKLEPPPWATDVDETNWKDELRKHLGKD